MYEKVVVRYNDGRIVRGWTENFTPSGSRMVVNPPNDPDRQQLVNLRDVKAIFFVRSFYGSPERVKRTGFGGEQCGRQSKVMIEFRDGERLWGCATSEVLPTSAGSFFLTPDDETSNNEKVYIMSSGVAAVVTS